MFVHRLNASVWRHTSGCDGIVPGSDGTFPGFDDTLPGSNDPLPGCDETLSGVATHFLVLRHTSVV